MKEIGFTFDKELLLHDGLAAITASGGGVVGGSAKVLDLGAGDAKTFFGAVVDISAFDTTTGDEKVVAIIQGSNDATFATGKRTLAMQEFGLDAQVNADGNHTVGRYYLAGINVDDTPAVTRYVRVFFVASGTTPSITCTVFLVKRV